MSFKKHLGRKCENSKWPPFFGSRKFFEIWAEQDNLNLEKAFSSNNVLDYTGAVTMSVNGESKTGSLESFIPSDGDIIQIICNTN